MFAAHVISWIKYLSRKPCQSCALGKADRKIGRRLGGRRKLQSGSRRWGNRSKTLKNPQSRQISVSGCVYRTTTLGGLIEAICRIVRAIEGRTKSSEKFAYLSQTAPNAAFRRRSAFFGAAQRCSTSLVRYEVESPWSCPAI